MNTPMVDLKLVKESILRIQMKNQIQEDDLRRIFLQIVEKEAEILDCGKSLRNYFNDAKSNFASVETIDINSFDDYPDHVVDICNETSMRKFKSRYDAISCFSLLEHCYDPMSACRNLFVALKKDGMIIGSAPFLFPRHSPEDLSYQDFFRFTRDAYAVLFPQAKSIELFPLRGRVATSLNVLTTRYRFNFEEKFPRISKKLNKVGSQGRQSLQCSGYGFIISK